MRKNRSTLIRYTFIASMVAYLGVLILDLIERAGWIGQATESGLRFAMVAAVVGSISLYARGGNLTRTARTALLASTIMLTLHQFLRFSADVTAWDSIPVIGNLGAAHEFAEKGLRGLWACGFIVFYFSMVKSAEDARLELTRAQEVLIRDARMSALGQLASGIAHDLNNALTPVVTYAALLNDERLDSDQKTWVEAISQAGRNISQVVKNLQLLYRQDDTNPPPECIEVRELCDQVALLTRPKWKDFPERTGHCINFQVDVEPRSSRLRGSLTEIRQVLINLIFNAAEAMPEGGRVTLKALTRDKSLVIEVSDSGIGMNTDQLQHCFDPFYTSKQEGTGLGLSACQSVVARHGGSVEVESQPGRGTTVRIILPAATQCATEPDSVAQSDQTSGARLLYVDDDPAVRDSMVSLCDSLGIEIEAVEDGPTALKRLRAMPCRAVITDLAMPGMDGIELTAAIKDSCSSVPVVVVSGWTKSDVLRRFRKGHAPDGVLEKPVTSGVLQTALAELPMHPD